MGESDDPSVPKRDLEAEAKDHISTVSDILGATPTSERSDRVAKLEALRAKKVAYLKNIRTSGNNPNEQHDKYVETEAEIREIDRLIAAEDPTTASVDLVGELAIGAAVDEARLKRDEARREQAKAFEQAEARRASEKAAFEAQQGDFERAVRATSDVPDPMAIDNARASDDMVNRHGCTPRVIGGITVAVLIAVTIAAVTFMGGDDPNCPASGGGGGRIAAAADECAPEATTVGSKAGEAGAVAPPAEADLPQGVMLFTGSSGGPIGCIACDGQSRFLALDREGVGVGNVSAAEFERQWDLDGEVLQFGARITAPNKGRYGVNLWIDGATYGPGVALEIGERSAEYQWSPERDGTLRAGTRMAIIVGEAGTVDDEGVPTAQGDYELEWWFTFQPD